MSEIDKNVEERSGRGIVTMDTCKGEAWRGDVDVVEGGDNPLSDNQQSTNQPVIPVKENGNYEYLDHTADVQLHSWGENLSEALEYLALAMFNYMSPLAGISINENVSLSVIEDEEANNANNSEGHSCLKVKGHDLHSLIYSYLDEWLYVFHSTGFIPKEIKVFDCISGSNDSDSGSHNDGGANVSGGTNKFHLKSFGKGEILNLDKHDQGTEVKAITYSNMMVFEKEGVTHVFVIVDI